MLFLALIIRITAGLISPLSSLAQLADNVLNLVLLSLDVVFYPLLEPLEVFRRPCAREIILFSASLHYSYSHRFGWSMRVAAFSLIFSTLMDYLCGIEVLWVYPSNEPMAVFIVFTWVLRVLTILEGSSLLRYRDSTVIMFPFARVQSLKIVHRKP